MSLDNHDLETIQLEAKILALKLERINENLSMLQKINKEILNEQIRSTGVLQQLISTFRKST